MRGRILRMREQFVERMAAEAPQRDFSFIESQRGMFSFSGLNEQQVKELRDKYSIYIVKSGRINVGVDDGVNYSAVGNWISMISSGPWPVFFSLWDGTMSFSSVFSAWWFWAMKP